MEQTEPGDHAKDTIGVSVAHCRDCGFDNPEGDRFCQACNADLAYQDILTGSNNDRQTGRYRALKDACDKVLAGTLSVEEFARILEERHASLQEQARAVLQEIHDTEYDKESPDEIALGVEGLHNYEVAIGEMYRYLQNYDPAHLEHGLSLAWEANEQILACMRLNRETRQGIIEEFRISYEAL